MMSSLIMMSASQLSLMLSELVKWRKDVVAVIKVRLVMI